MSRKYFSLCDGDDTNLLVGATSVTRYSAIDVELENIMRATFANVPLLNENLWPLRKNLSLKK